MAQEGEQERLAGEKSTEAEGAAVEQAREEPIVREQAETDSLAAAVKAGEAAFAAAKEALAKGDIDAASSSVYTAAQEFERGGLDRLAEVADLGKQIAAAGDQQAAEAAARKREVDEEAAAAHERQQKQQHEAAGERALGVARDKLAAGDLDGAKEAQSLAAGEFRQAGTDKATVLAELEAAVAQAMMHKDAAERKREHIVAAQAASEDARAKLRAGDVAAARAARALAAEQLRLAGEFAATGSEALAVLDAELAVHDVEQVDEGCCGGGRGCIYKYECVRV